MNGKRPLFRAIVVILGMLALVGAAIAAPKKGNHHSGKDLVGERIKTNGVHHIHQNGEHAVSVHVKDGKIAAFHVKHSKKGEVAVTKYKTNKKLAEADGTHPGASPAQTVIGVTYIGYSYVDDYGVEQIYWFPYDMILDPSGAIEYVPA